MKIIIDADACPVLDIAVDNARAEGIECVIVCDNSHNIQRDGALTVVVDKGADSADCRIANLCSRGDIVITQDYGLAALALGKGASAVNQNGIVFTDTNIENYLYSRYLGKKERLAGNRTKGPKKRTAVNDSDFLREFTKLLQEALSRDFIG